MFFQLIQLLPREILRKYNSKIIKNKNLNVTNIINEGVKNANCVMTDAWVSMGENNSKKKYFKKSSEPVDYSTKRKYENYIEKIASEDSEPDKNNFFLRIITWVFWGSLFYFVFLN